jgi:hypothetical protein
VCFCFVKSLTTRCVTFGLIAVAFPFILVLVNSTPDRIPADVIMEEQAQAAEEEQDDMEKKDDGIVTYRAA